MHLKCTYTFLCTHPCTHFSITHSLHALTYLSSIKQSSMYKLCQIKKACDIQNPLSL